MDVNISNASKAATDQYLIFDGNTAGLCLLTQHGALNSPLRFHKVFIKVIRNRSEIVQNIQFIVGNKCSDKTSIAYAICQQ
jgi:hypothetical protein|tara:strand:+ start:1822 stop:2064 length:243 start_codon:yes stop_codon:yes gene_type:complete